MNDECFELKSIEYKSMMLNSNKKNNQIKSNIEINIDENELMHKLLNNETEFQNSNNNKKSWNKLDKMTKQQKLNEYALKLKSIHNLNDNEFDNLLIYLQTCNDRKRFSSSKDVLYDIETMNITDIPNLVISSSCLKTKQNEQMKKDRKFTLKSIEKKNSTLKNLPKRIKKKMKIEN